MTKNGTGGGGRGVNSHSMPYHEIAQMVERPTEELEVPGSNPTTGNFFYCSVSQAIECIKSLPNRRTTKYQCTWHDDADDKRPNGTMMTA